jgi:hypothetical protein
MSSNVVDLILFWFKFVFRDLHWFILYSIGVGLILLIVYLLKRRYCKNNHKK